MKTTKVFFDTEFTGLHQNTTLISIGLISECGKTFYAEFTDYDEFQIDDWLKDNVIKNLNLDRKKDAHWHIFNEYTSKFIEGIDINAIKIISHKEVIKKVLLFWLSQFEKVEMWSDCLAYDWILFNNIFGTAFDIPKNVYYIPFDICTLMKIKGIDPDITRENFVTDNLHLCDFDKLGRELNQNWKQAGKHNALWDAFIIKCSCEVLMKL